MAKYFNLVPCKGFVWKESFINCITRCGSIIHINFSWVFSSKVPCFTLVLLFKGTVGGTVTKKYTLKKCTLWCTQGALSGCNKAESLKTRWYVLSKNKACISWPREIDLVKHNTLQKSSLAHSSHSLNVAYSILPSLKGIIWKCVLNIHSSQKCNL